MKRSAEESELYGAAQWSGVYSLGHGTGDGKKVWKSEVPGGCGATGREGGSDGQKWKEAMNVEGIRSVSVAANPGGVGGGPGRQKKGQRGTRSVCTNSNSLNCKSAKRRIGARDGGPLAPHFLFTAKTLARGTRAVNSITFRTASCPRLSWQSRIDLADNSGFLIADRMECGRPHIN